MKKTPSIIDTYYKSLGTKIFKDTTALPFADGGPLNDRNIHGDLLPSVYASALGRYYGNGGQMKPDYSLPEDSFQQGGQGLENSVYASSMGQYPAPYAMGGAMNQYPDGGPIYTYAKRPGSYYQKDENGQWLISNKGTGGQYVPVDDPSGQRTAALNKGAVVYNQPVQEGVKPAPLQFTGNINQPVEPAYNPLYTNPNAKYSETTQQVASKLVPQTKQGKQDLEFVKQNNANRKADVETFLTTQGHTPEEAAQIVGSYGSDWTDLEGKYANDIQTMNQTAATISQGGNPDSMQEFVPREAQSLGGKVEDMMFNPFTTAGYALRGQAIPDYMGEKIDNGTLGYYANGQFIQGRNMLDNVTDVATPIGWAHSGKNIAERATNDKSGDFWTEENAWDALNVLPGLGFAKAAKVARGVEAANSTTGLARLGNNVVDLAERAQLTRTKPQIIESAIDAGSIAREPFYAPQRPSLLNPGTSVNDGAQLSQNSIGSKITNKLFPNTKQFIKEVKARDASTEPLREAEQWMKEWTSHPATQQKIANSYTDAINQPMEIEGLSKMNLTDRMAAKDAYSNNLKRGYEQITNYDPTGKLNYYPLRKQFIDNFLNPSAGNIHVDNTGVNYTHLSPPEGLISPELMNKAEFATNLDHSRVGSWVSRAMSDEEKLYTGIHELTHDYGKDFPLEYLGQKKMIDDNIGTNVEKLRTNLQTKLDATSKFNRKEINKLTELMDDLNYMSTPTEVHARIMELRKQYGIKPDDIIGEKQAQGVLDDIYNNKTSVNPRFSQILGNNKSASNIFNNAWMTIPALGAGALLDASSSTETNSHARGGFINQYPDGGVLGAASNLVPTTPVLEGPGIPGEQDVRDFYTNWYSKRTLPFDEIGNKQYEKTMKSILPAYNPESTLLNEINANKVPYEVVPSLDGENAQGAIVYNKKGFPEKIELGQSIMNNPRELNATMTHEERTRIMNPYADKVYPAEQKIIEPSIKSFEEISESIKDPANREAAGNYYDYLTSPQEDNIQSMLFEIRQQKNLQPDQVITDEDIENWKLEGEKSGELDKSSPNYNGALYNLFKLSKDNSSMKNLFNYIASDNTPKSNNMNMFPTYGGNFV